MSAQSTASIHGRTVDAQHRPVLAEVSLLPAANSVSSGEGEFSIDVRPGPYRIEIRKAGFTPFSKSLNVPPEGLDLGDILLSIQPIDGAITVREDGGYVSTVISSATRTIMPLRDIPQSVTAVTREQIQDQNMMSVGDVARYIPGVTSVQGENNRDQLVIRGNSTSADFFLDGIRDDVQYYRDLYTAETVEALKGPNAMIFGRGGGGGVINRVSKEASPVALRDVTFQVGSFGDKRFTVDLDRPFTKNFAGRLNAVYEDSGSFRNGVDLKRYGLNPTLAYAPGSATRFTFGYENFRDFRTADRGIPSFLGQPVDVDPSTFFGRSDASHVRALVNIGSVGFEHRFTSRFGIRNRTLVGDYNRGYQNFVPGAVTADGLLDSLSAYNNATERRNIFNQTDATCTRSTGRIRHTVTGGVEYGRQFTDNLRKTGYFNSSSTSILVPLDSPRFDIPFDFHQSATDANNHIDTEVEAAYVQDQIAVSHQLQFITGARFDRFDLRYHDNRSGSDLRRVDNLVSPRAGVVYKPLTPLSLYGSYSVSWLPSAGDQFSSLTVVTSQVRPEKFTNYEGGVKVDLTGSLFLTSAVYRLDRTNTRSIDPNDATRIVQTGSQRSTGFEAGVSGTVRRFWQIAGGFAEQRAVVLHATASARAGARVAQVPRQTCSLWNNLQVAPRLSVGIGLINRTDMFAAIDNTVVLPGYSRVDGALFFRLSERARLQANVENVLGNEYFLNADNNTNISPGSPRSVRFSLLIHLW